MNTTTLNLDTGPRRFQKKPSDWIYALLVIGAAFGVFWRYGQSMDIYERSILVFTAPVLVWLGWFWRPVQRLVGIVTLATLAAISLYMRHLDSFGADLSQADNIFWLKYFLSSQSAILWMSVLFFMSTIFYWLGLLVPKKTETSGLTAFKIGSMLAWAGVTMALIGTMVRWFESHQIGPDIGHIPVSNLYEVFVLFSWMTTLFYLYYQSKYKAWSLGAFVMLVVSAAVGFLLWYTVARSAQEIQPLVPALQSWWMKVHVPANFIGYGTFAMSAMVALACLLKESSAKALWTGLVAIPTGITFMVGAYAVLGQDPKTVAAAAKTTQMLAGTTLFFALMVMGRKPLNARTPSVQLMDDLMYKAIALGFAFFTIATILGALWAAEAWGGYWSWDPKETWALIVWLNYASWLHMRLMKGLRGSLAAWWALTGLVVTTFAFLGVNMFLSGLYSYGEL